MKLRFKILSQSPDNELYSTPVEDEQEGRFTNSLVEQLQERGHRIACVLPEEANQSRERKRSSYRNYR